MIIYFTGTGNSRFAANYLADILQDEVVDATTLMKAGTNGDFHSDRPYVIVSPIYSWRMPAVFENFLRESVFHGSKMVYFVQTCGGDMGACGQYNQTLCIDKGLEYFGSVEAIMPDNYILMFKAPEYKESVRIIKKALPALNEAAEKIQNMIPFEEKKVSFADRLKSGIVNNGFNKQFVKADGFYAAEECIGCGVCVKACPLNNISLNEGKPVWGTHCTQCMACICGCPKSAIEYGKKTKGKLRYQCPKTLDE